MNNSTRLIVSKLLETKRLAIKDYRISRIHPHDGNSWTSKYIEELKKEYNDFIYEVNKEIKELRGN